MKIKINPKIEYFLYSIKKDLKKDNKYSEKIIIKCDESEKMYTLEYNAYSNNIIYSQSSNLYDLSLEKLFKIIKKDYNIIFFRNLVKRKSEIIKALSNNSEIIIPMEECCFIKKNIKKSKISIRIDGEKIISENIDDKTIILLKELQLSTGK